MITMMDRPIGRVPEIPPLPPFVTPEELLADALPLLDPPSRMTVADAAEAFVHVPIAGSWGKFDRMVTPYMVEPGNITQSRRFGAVVLVGPAQSGKTMVLQTVAAHAIMCQPDPIQIIHMTKSDADAWVEEKLDPMIENSPFLVERLGKGRDDSTFSRKRFKGMRLTIGYPVPNQLSSRTQRGVLLTDYDHMPQRLGPKDSPEGSPFKMAESRIRTYMSRGFIFAESTPAFPVTDETFRFDPLAPHLFPRVSAGIVNLYNDGTRGRWYWECRDCGELYEPRFDRLHYDPTLEPAEAGAKAHMECPHCHCLTSHLHKVELNRAALAGRGGWLHEGTRILERADGTKYRELVPIDDSSVRATETASYALNGAAAAFSSWSQLVKRYETERRKFEMFDDSADFAKVHYTEIGVPWAPHAFADDDDLTVATLRDKLKAAERKIAPSWARFITVSIDTNGSWFAVMVTAWGIDGTRMPLDRFDLREPPETAPRARDSEGRMRALDPGKHVKDADVLLDLADVVYEVQGERYGLKPIALTLDFNGPAGWSDNAEKFWRARKRDGDGGKWFLSIGRSGFKQRDRVWHEAPERGSKGKAARGIKLLNMAVDRIKDTVLAALGREDGEAGAYPLPSWFEEERLSEILAERRGDNGYEKKPGVVRNETLDLSVQAQATAEHLGLNRINPEAPPFWAEIGPGNPHAVQLDLVEPKGDETPPAPNPDPEPPRPRRIKYLGR